MKPFHDMLAQKLIDIAEKYYKDTGRKELAYLRNNKSDIVAYNNSFENMVDIDDIDFGKIHISELVWSCEGECIFELPWTIKPTKYCPVCGNIISLSFSKKKEKNT